MWEKVQQQQGFEGVVWVGAGETDRRIWIK